MYLTRFPLVPTYQVPVPRFPFLSFLWFYPLPYSAVMTVRGMRVMFHSARSFIRSSTPMLFI